MGDFLLGILAIIMVFITLLLKDSENKWISWIGWGIIILAKIFN